MRTRPKYSDMCKETERYLNSQYDLKKEAQTWTYHTPCFKPDDICRVIKTVWYRNKRNTHRSMEQN